MGVDLDRFVKEVPEVLHCPVCLDTAYPPVLVCQSEHALCEGCAVHLVAARSLACPTCRQAMSFPLRRSFIATRTIEEYKCVQGPLVGEFR